jgi:acyl-CoA thioester hydrolase
VGALNENNPHTGVEKNQGRGGAGWACTHNGNIAIDGLRAHGPIVGASANLRNAIPRTINLANYAAICASTAPELRIPFHDVDALGVVWHGHYAKYYEQSSMNLLREHGLDVPVLQTLGFAVYVMELRCRYMQPLRYHDPVRITATLKEIDPCIVITNVIHNLDTEKRCSRARTTLVMTDRDGNLQLETPHEILSLLQ